MKTPLLLLFIALVSTSCFYEEDPGPIQSKTNEYAVTGFDRLEISDALHVTVAYGSTFYIKAEGDRRNLDDLIVNKIDNTLRLKFDHDGRPESRQYTTYVTISMPALHGVSLSGAVTCDVAGFESGDDMSFRLSGASKATVRGRVNGFAAEVSGASELRAFDLETETATIEASGASKAEVFATRQLKADASGASRIRYRGNPVLTANTSGASSIGIE